MMKIVVFSFWNVGHDINLISRNGHFTQQIFLSCHNWKNVALITLMTDEAWWSFFLKNGIAYQTTPFCDSPHSKFSLSVGCIFRWCTKTMVHLGLTTYLFTPYPSIQLLWAECFKRQWQGANFTLHWRQPVGCGELVYDKWTTYYTNMHCKSYTSKE